MNIAIISGYVSSDIELKTVKDGVYVCDFSLAVKRPGIKDTTDFINVVCWRKTAEFVTKFFQKGDGMEVSGIITTRSWKDENGNSKHTTEILANQIEFGKKRKETAPGVNESNINIQVDDKAKSGPVIQTTATAINSFDSFESTDDDLPF